MSKRIKNPLNLKRPTALKIKLSEPPGTVTYTGFREKTKSKVKVILYDEDTLDELIPDNVEEIASASQSGRVAWVDVSGLSDEAFIGELGQKIGLNPLTMEDAVNTHQRPKIDDYGDYIFVVFKMLYIVEDDTLISEHVAMVLKGNAVFVFQEMAEDVFNGIRDRLTRKSGRIRERNSDYLLFALLDAIVDNYFVVLEWLHRRLDTLEELVYADPRNDRAKEIQQLKKEVLQIRWRIFPAKELVTRLINSENPMIHSETKLFLADVLDHAVEINERMQIYREMSVSIMEMYMSSMSNKMNEVMEVLTIMTSIFIPLSFVAGVYGMNFDNMPELHWPNGYYYVLGLMVLVVIGLLIFFRRRKWL